MKELIEKSEQFKMSQLEVDAVERGRLGFIERFPKEAIISLKVDEYANIKLKDTFIYWLEFKNILFGIGGGNASKFGIYKATEDGKYYLGQGSKKKLLEGEELEHRFFSLKKGIVSALEFTEQNRIDEILKIDSTIWKMVLQKILCIYYPEKFINIGSSEVLIKCAEDIELSDIDLSPTNLILINHECKKRLIARKELAGWNYAQLGTLVWNVYKNDMKQKAPNDNSSNKNVKKYWLYSPDKEALRWEEFYRDGIMALGWDKLGDLNQYSSQREIAEKFRMLENTTSSKANNSLANFEFLQVMKVGDIVIPKKGRTTYLGYGIVKSNYIFDDSRKDFKSIRYVDWKKKGEFEETEGKIVLKALTDVTKYPEYVPKLAKLLGIDSEFEEGKSIDIKQKINLPLNIILYGPPGTGKTYNSIDKAVQIVSGSSSNNHAENKKVFDELRKQGQIEFVTFHQNYSYEDFVVGISPDVTSGTLRFDKREGTFKKLAEKAKQNWLIATGNNAVDFDFDYVFNSFFSKLIEEEEKEIEIPMKRRGHSFKITSIDVDNGRIKFTKQSGGTGHDLLVKNVKAMFDGSFDYAIDGLGVYYHPLADKLKEHAVTLQPNKPTEELKNFVLIIDEINRANISKVFGELITLLEEDKRLGQPNELKITLPNGERDFGVPSNLYIIGTMNTADKSIALIDIALRRRFEFIGKYPTYDVLAPDAAALLEKINVAIYEKKKSADYLVGHAYFMKNQPIESVLQNSVIPLLMEYFSGKSEIVSSVFESSGWNVDYDSSAFSWSISKA